MYYNDTFTKSGPKKQDFRDVSRFKESGNSLSQNECTLTMLDQTERKKKGLWVILSTAMPTSDVTAPRPFVFQVVLASVGKITSLDLERISKHA